jgi:uncharacterized membrane protein HdeD (DUF308 family)
MIGAALKWCCFACAHSKLSPRGGIKSVRRGSKADIMAIVLATNWWALALRGVVAILFAIFAFFWPGVTLAFIVLLFGVYAFIDGVLAIVSAVRALRGHRRWGAFLFEGIVGILAGLCAFFVPGITLAFLIFLVAAWAIITGVLEISAAIRLRRHIPGEWLLIIAGVISILFGIMLYIAPIAGAIVIVWWLGAYALIFGILLLILAFRLRSLHPRLLAQSQPL